MQDAVVIQAMMTGEACVKSDLDSDFTDRKDVREALTYSNLRANQIMYSMMNHK